MVIELESSQLLKALEQLPPKELKRIIDTFFKEPSGKARF